MVKESKIVMDGQDSDGQESDGQESDGKEEEKKRERDKAGAFPNKKVCPNYSGVDLYSFPIIQPYSTQLMINQSSK